MMKQVLLLIVFSLVSRLYQAQSTTECGVTKGCFLDPSGCSGTACTFMYQYATNGDYVDFDLYAKNSGGNPWLAIGFSNDQSMGDDGVCMCASNGVVDQRYNSGQSEPGLLDSSNPTVGILNATVSTSNGFLRCSFSRLKKNDAVSRYFDINNQYYLLAATGQYSTARAAVSSFQQHSSDAASSAKVDYSSFSVVGAGDTLKKVKAHGAIMVFAWMLIASTGIIFARYYKFLLSDRELCGVDIWFALHRPLMAMVPILSLIGLLLILSSLDWEWVESDEKLEFTHSIFGIVAIAFAFVQPVMAFFRPDKSSRFRFIFNWLHRSVGFSALIFAIVAIFLGTVIDVLDLESRGWGIMLGWTIWLVLYIIIMEILDFVFGNEYEEGERTTDMLIKEILLLLHVVVTLAFTIALVVVIATAGSESESD